MTSADLVEALRDPRCFPHPVDAVDLVETHISWVLLAGDYAYKLKKPVDLGFLDFSTLARRRRFCEEELRLNRRTAPDVYLDVVAISGTREHPVVGGGGPAIEWAVKMRRFARDCGFDALIERGELDAAQVDALAAVVADFHDRVEVADAVSPWGTPEAVLAPCEQNFAQLTALALGGGRDARLRALRDWTLASHARLAETIVRRWARQRVRECHGDLHMANIVLIDAKPVLFDAIEFDPALRWTDVFAEVAFVVMDLERRGRHELAQAFLDGYLARCGDYDGLALLSFFCVYRALVRAKVAALRATQRGEDAAGGKDPPDAPPGQCLDLAEFDACVALAERFAAPRAVRLLLTHGVSGSGKSHVAHDLVEAGDWIRLRSDVERKRLGGLAPLAASGSSIGEGLYSAEATERTYSRLESLAATVLSAGYPAIVDATFLRARQRAPFAALAREAGVGWAILAVRAPRELLRERVEARARDGGDPSEATIAVLEAQSREIEAPEGEERARTVVVDTSRGIDAAAIGAAIETAARAPATP